MTFLTVNKNKNVFYLKSSSLFLPAKELLLELLPLEFKPLLTENTKNIESKAIDLQKKLPIIKSEIFNQTIVLKILSFSDKNSETAPFIQDMLSGFSLDVALKIDSSFFLNFTFSRASFITFFLAEYTIRINSEKERKNILENLPYFIDQLKINLLSLHSARHLTKGSNLQPAFTNFFYKKASQKNLLQIKENLNRLMNRRQLPSNRNLFETIKNLTLLFDENFTSQKDPRYISKLTAFIYLFKNSFQPGSLERQIRYKIFKNIYSDPEKKDFILGLLISLNINSETERFEKKHLMQAIKSCIPYAHALKDSWIQDSSENCKIFYVEIEKSNTFKFSLDEINTLKASLSEEVKERIEKLLSPIFMPRNEEEILRNIILLSKQLKYVKDLPQVIISYDKQTEKELIFQVILLRILKKDSISLEKLFLQAKTFLKFIPEEVKIIGILKKKYSKEANLFKVSLDKAPYFRKDFSLDLQKARCGIVSEMKKIIGEFRDFNGGMIFKQSEALYQLKKELPELRHNEEFLLENFFFSLKPAIQQSILDIEAIKAFFLLFLHVLERDLSEQKFLIKTLSMSKYILIMIGTEDLSFRNPLETAIKKLKLSSFDITSCFYHKNKNYLLGYIYKTQDLAKHSLFYHALLNTLNDWKNNRSHRRPHV